MPIEGMVDSKIENDKEAITKSIAATKNLNDFIEAITKIPSIKIPNKDNEDIFHTGAQYAESIKVMFDKELSKCAMAITREYGIRAKFTKLYDQKEGLFDDEASVTSTTNMMLSLGNHTKQEVELKDERALIAEVEQCKTKSQLLEWTLSQKAIPSSIGELPGEHVARILRHHWQGVPEAHKWVIPSAFKIRDKAVQLKNKFEKVVTFKKSVTFNPKKKVILLRRREHDMTKNDVKSACDNGNTTSLKHY